MSLTIRPKSDRVLIRRIESPDRIGSIYVPDRARETLYEGIVLAVGPGRVSEKNVLIPMALSVGSRVMWGKYSGIVLEQDGEPLMLLREEEVIMELLPEEEEHPSYRVVATSAGCGHEVILRAHVGQSVQIPLLCKECGNFTENVEAVEKRIDVE